MAAASFVRLLVVAGNLCRTTFRRVVAPVAASLPFLRGRGGHHPLPFHGGGGGVSLPSSGGGSSGSVPFLNLLPSDS
ncbi:unnamed protein product [Urochloa humidicola]